MDENYDRVIDFAERYFQRSGQTMFPSVRHVARACRCTQDFVVEAAESTGRACLDGVNIANWTLGDLEVYVTRP